MIVDEPIRGSFAYLEQPGLFGMSGVDQLRLFIDGRLPSPPLTHLSGLVVEDAAAGTSTWSIPASAWWQTAAGVFAGGTLGFVADAALAGAVFTTLPRSMALLSSDLSINFLEPASVERAIDRYGDRYPCRAAPGVVGGPGGGRPRRPPRARDLALCAAATPVRAAEAARGVPTR